MSNTLEIGWGLNPAAASTAAGRIVALDHLTLPILENSMRESSLARFLLQALSCTHDSTQTRIHLNLGMHQIHLLPCQQPLDVRFPGRIVVLFRTRPKHQILVDPHGNVYECHQAPSDFIAFSARIGRFPGGTLMNPVVGMPILEHHVPLETTDGIARYFRHFFECTSVLESDAKTGQALCIVPTGPYQRLVFRESVQCMVEKISSGSPKKTRTRTRTTQTRALGHHHICLYVDQFKACFHRFERAGLLFDNPRYPEQCLTWSVAQSRAQFRSFDLVDPESGEYLFSFEQEIRSLQHPENVLRRHMILDDST